ncbi:MAG: VOC family protein [Flammeovirgaceae bacterium]|nr:VOC family protein [Flammeovirgaceae bacterium]|tara:strand:- start:1212 stop:1637 length:426 start_codon:yes stop_codon:yes gene_type:complete
MSTLSPFHLAIPVHDVQVCRSFYRDILHCKEGRSDPKWVDFDFFGHQLVIHEVASNTKPIEDHNPVDGHDVPVPHFGVVLEMAVWMSLAERLKDMGINFIIEPYIRFVGQPGEQATMFFKDPSGNALEFKAFKDIGQLFAK